MLLLDVEVNLLLERERLWFWDERLGMARPREDC